MKDAAAKAANQVLLESAKIVGAITIGIGVVTSIWDGYKLAEACEKSDENYKSAFSEALRRIGKQLIVQLRGREISETESGYDSPYEDE